jgi:hypothetical protein
MPRETVALPSFEELNRLFAYSIVTGKLHRKQSRGGALKGSEAGWLKEDGYIGVGLNDRMYYAHRLAWKLVTREDPVRYIDHIDGDRSNNAWHNLREATHQQNHYNQSLRADSTTKLKGVGWDVKARKYRARITIDGRRCHLGFFETPEEAYDIYCRAAALHYGEFCRLA